MMSIRIIGIVSLLLLSACRHAGGEEVYASIREELLRMEEEDQAVAGRLAANAEEMRIAEAELTEVSARHVSRLKEIVQRHGWPRRSLVGDEAAAAAWVLVQHADHDPLFQRQVLAMLEPLVAAGEVEPKHYAYLWDRTNEPQRFGTQGGCVARGVWEPRPIEAPAEVDTRRAAAGIFPIALSDYIGVMSSLCEHRVDLDPAPEYRPD
jgi:hypothetical protein